MADGPILVIAGGAGFIGANFARYVAAARPEWQLRVLDKLTYAGDRARLAGIDADFIAGDIADPQAAASVLADARWLVNFAAETHVDRSLQDAQAFLRTNVTGTFVLMSAASEAGVERIVHISTDEVYGESHGESFHEDDLLRPRSPYSASKAGGDLQVLALHATYGLPVCITRGANTIGGWQHPEKAVPLFTINALLNKPLPLYGRGEQRRDRLHVDDHSRAVLTVLERGEVGTVYNVAAGNNRDNLTVAKAVLERLDRPESLIRFVEDRPGHDWDYIMDASRLAALGWQPEHDFESALSLTVDWYVAHRDWWEPIVAGEFQDYYDRLYGRRLATSEAYRP
ncbi:MAG: dTDP-glucose 4,6-dehydratase [Chloroflexi bacterium]|nr:dTDP-glucose 4,6-dehydratase [Chloroflexota bacterium]